MLECTLFAPDGAWPAVSGQAVIAFILQFKSALEAALQTYPDLHVDCAGVTEADFSCMQLLWSAHQSYSGMRVTPASCEVLGPVILASGLDRIEGCCMADHSDDRFWSCPDASPGKV